MADNSIPKRIGPAALLVLLTALGASALAAIGGFANPMSATGDLIVGGDAGVPTRLAAGSQGYILRTISGTPTWRELSGSGLTADRPTCTAGREGQEYWATDGTAGLQRSRCVHQGASTYAWTLVAYGVTATGSSLLRAADAGAAREAIGAAYDPTTTHGDLIVRDDAGLARVAVGTTGQVLTVGDAGIPVWRDPTSTTSWTTLAPSDLTLVDGTGSASLVDGRVRLTQTANTTSWYGYVSSVWQAAPGPYAWLAIPAGTREVVALARVYTGSPALDYRTTALLLRNGSDVTAAPTAPTPGVGFGVKLVGHGVWGHGSYPFGTWDTSYPSSSGLGVAWSATPGATTRWIGVRWTPGRADAVACDASGTPTIDDVLVHPTYTVTPAWPAPTLLVLALQRLTGGSAGTSTVDLDFVGWRR